MGAGPPPGTLHCRWPAAPGEPACMQNSAAADLAAAVNLQPAAADSCRRQAAGSAPAAGGCSGPAPQSQHRPAAAPRLQAPRLRSAGADEPQAACTGARAARAACCAHHGQAGTCQHGLQGGTRSGWLKHCPCSRLTHNGAAVLAPQQAAHAAASAHGQVAGVAGKNLALQGGLDQVARRAHALQG